MEPEDWVHVRVMTKVSNDYSHGNGEKGGDTWYTPQKKNKMAMENHSF